MALRQLPEEFLTMLSETGLEELQTALAEGEPCTSLRLNRRKGASVTGPAYPATPVPWCDGGFYLDERPRFTFDPMLHQGCYYVQEASSMFHSHVVRQLTAGAAGPLRVLDSCAAPGGKTTAVIDSLPDGSLMVANEYVPSRAAILRENIIKWGYPSVVVTRGDTAAFRHLKESFDLIIADVPCSGEGMMRKDEDAVSQWSRGLIRECAERQWEIVGNLWSALKPGGCLIYSTCTFNRTENEEMVGRIISELGGESVKIDINPDWGIAPGIDTSAHCYRFLPGRVRGEGLFVAVIRKSGEPRPEKSSSKPKKDKGKKSKPLPQLGQATSWLPDGLRDDFEVYSEDDRISTFPSIHVPILKKIKNELDIIHEGILIGTVKGKDLIPSQSLAMLSPVSGCFPTHGLNKEEAIAYLSGDAVSLPPDMPRGYITVTYNDRPLGFVKNIGNRSNNLYPSPWRIKTKPN